MIKKRYQWRVIFRLFLVYLIISLVTGGGLPVKAQDTTYQTVRHVIETRPNTENEKIYELLVNNEVVLRYRSLYQGISAQERAKIIMERIKSYGNTLQRIEVGLVNQCPVVLADGKVLITVTEADWEANNSTGEGLAVVWANQLKEALKKGVPLNNGDSPANTGEQAPQNGSSPDVAANHNGEASNTPDLDLVAQGDISQEEVQMLELINKERALAGVAPLVIDKELVKIARLKSQDMIDKNYFDHNSPTYGDPFTMLKDFGIKYGYAGENLAGNQTVDKAHEALMNSPGHRKNILSPNYTHVGIGIVEGGPYGSMYTQLFISKTE